MADVQLFGLDPGGHHLVNVGIHLLNVLGLFWLLRGLTGARWPSAFVAGLFALHPVQVESVAWIAERKNLLSTLFGLAAIAAYARHAARPSTSRLAAVFLLFALSLAAKPMLVTLPLLLLLLDFWPLRRLPSADPRRTRALLLEKLPLLALSSASAVVTLVAQRGGGALLPLESVGVGARLANAILSYAVYLRQLVWPSGLALPYPYPESISPAAVAGSAALLIGITVAVAAAGRSRPWLAVGWSWFLLSLVPVIGIVQVGGQAMADRYLYWPSIGIGLAVAWSFRGRRAAAFAAIPLLLAAAFLARRQVGFWSDTETLFRRAVEVTRQNYVAHTYLAVELHRKGEIDAAVEQLEAVARTGAAFADAEYTMGRIRTERGDLPQAAAAYRRALELEPAHGGALLELGRLLEARGARETALAHYREAVRLRPDDPALLNNLGVILTREGRASEALEPLERACRLDPAEPEPRNSLGVALLELGRAEQAESAFASALERDPGHLEALLNLGVGRAAQRPAGPRGDPIRAGDPGRSGLRRRARRPRRHPGLWRGTRAGPAKPTSGLSGLPPKHGKSGKSWIFCPSGLWHRPQSDGI